jgi:hypothetical protein
VDEVAFGRYRLIAAIVVVIGVILVAAGIAGYLLQPHPPASQTPTVLPAQPSGPTVQSAPAIPPTAPPSAAADVPGLAPFVGSWHAHEEGLDIQPNGNGRETYADKSTCPDAPAAGCGITGTVDFTLTSVSGDTATGAITAASNPKHPIGGPVTIKLVGDGQGLQLSVAGGDQGFPFCNSNDNLDASHYYCGA